MSILMKKLCIIAFLGSFLGVSSNINSSGISLSSAVALSTVLEETREINKMKHQSVLRDHFKFILDALLPATSVQTALAFIYNTCGISNTELQQAAKQSTIEKYNLREVSPEWRVLIDEALKDMGMSSNIVFLEGDELLEEGETVGFHTMPFPFSISVIVLKSLERYASKGLALHTLYHELGHAYHQHNLKSQLVFPVALATALVLLYPTKKFGGGISLALVTPLMAALLVKFYPDISRHYSIAHEKEADLFACEQLIKNNKAYAVIEHLPTVETSSRRPSGEEQREYMIQSLLAHKDKIPTGALKNIDALLLKLVIDDNDVELIRELLDLGAAFSCEGRFSPLAMAILEQKFDIVEEFLKHDIMLEVCHEEEDPLVLYALSYNKPKVRELANKYKKFGDSPPVQKALT